MDDLIQQLASISLEYKIYIGTAIGITCGVAQQIWEYYI